MKNHEYSFAYGNTLTDVNERKRAAHLLLSQYKAKGIIKNTHLSGPIIDGFAYVGPVTSAIRSIGGRSITVVEIVPEYVNTGILLGNIKPEVDKIRSGVDFRDFLSNMASTGELASMIVCLGVGCHDFGDPTEMRIKTLDCLQPGGGLLLFSGLLAMGSTFSDYEKLHGGKHYEGGLGIHEWDTERYIEYKE